MKSNSPMISKKARRHSVAVTQPTTTSETTTIPPQNQAEPTPLLESNTDDKHAPIASEITLTQSSVESPHSTLDEMLTITATHPTPAPLPQWCLGCDSWQSLAEAVVGLAHRDKQLPCQDAVACHHHPRPVLVVCDGAGSAEVSELGSAAVSQGLARLIHSLEPLLIPLLDTPHTLPHDLQDDLIYWVRVFLRHAKGILEDLAQQHRRSIRDFRTTLLLVVAGKAQLLWLKVGDGALVLEKIACHSQMQSTTSLQPWLFCLGHAGKGEFANQTTFIDDQIRLSDAQYGLHPSAHITGMAVMSDGAAEKLVTLNSELVAGQVSQWLDKLRQQQLRRQHLTQTFYSERFNQYSTGDDRSIALAARVFEIPKSS